MSLNYVTLTGTLPWAGGAVASAMLSGWTPDATDELLLPPAGPQPVTLSNTTVNGQPAGTFSLGGLVANDNANLPAGTYWTVTIKGIPGVALFEQTYVLDYANGASQDISGLTPYTPPTPVTAVMPAPSGTPQTGYVPAWTGPGQASEWQAQQGGGGAVSSVFGRTGAVVAESGDYTAAQVGADASGAAATAQSNAESFAMSAVAAETSRAETAEALLAPKASPALTGAPTAPTQSAGDDSTKLATTAYVDGKVVSGQFLCTPSSYAPGTLATLSITSATYTAFSSANINTGNFIAPPSGTVKVIVSGVFLQATGTSVVGVALAAHGTVSPLVAPAVQFSVPNNSGHAPTVFEFVVTGLTPGSTYNFDLLGATFTTADAFELFAADNTNTTIQAGSYGAPVTMTVQAV